MMRPRSNAGSAVSLPGSVCYLILMAPGFDYAGNGRADLPVWAAARRCAGVNVSGPVRAELLRLDSKATVIGRQGKRSRARAKLLRVPNGRKMHWSSFPCSQRSSSISYRLARRPGRSLSSRSLPWRSTFDETVRALTAGPAAVGEAIFNGAERCRGIIYVSPVWRPVMMIIRAIPEALFKKLSIQETIDLMAMKAQKRWLRQSILSAFISS